MTTKTNSPTPMVSVPLRLAELIDRVFLPTNPNRMRKADQSVVQAARDFRRIVNAGPRVTPEAARIAELEGALAAVVAAHNASGRMGSGPEFDAVRSARALLANKEG